MRILCDVLAFVVMCLHVLAKNMMFAHVSLLCCMCLHVFSLIVLLFIMCVLLHVLKHGVPCFAIVFFWYSISGRKNVLCE